MHVSKLDKRLFHCRRSLRLLPPSLPPSLLFSVWHQVEAEQLATSLLEAEHAVLERLFPRHVIERMAAAYKSQHQPRQQLQQLQEVARMVESGSSRESPSATINRMDRSVGRGTKKRPVLRSFTGQLLKPTSGRLPHVGNVSTSSAAAAATSSAVLALPDDHCLTSHEQVGFEAFNKCGGFFLCLLKT